MRQEKSQKNMQIHILIEPVAGNGYRARGGEPLSLSADGVTQEEAMANLKEKLQARLSHGAVVVPLELSSSSHPLSDLVGIFKDDPLIEDWKKSMRAYRRKRDKDAGKP
jgi:hypothetical protein